MVATLHLQECYAIDDPHDRGAKREQVTQWVELKDEFAVEYNQRYTCHSQQRVGVETLRGLLLTADKLHGQRREQRCCRNDYGHIRCLRV